MRCVVPFPSCWRLHGAANSQGHGGPVVQRKDLLLVVLDNSYSLDFGRRRHDFEKARDTAAELVQELQRGSDVNVVLMSDPKTPLYDTSVFNTEAVAEELKAMQAGFGQAQVSTALEHGAEVVEHEPPAP